MIPLFFPYLVNKHITIYLYKSLNNLFTVCYSHEYFFSLVLKEILTLHCWIWWEDNGFQIPEGGVHCQVLPLKNVICWHTECWGREGKQFVTELDHFLHWWDFFVHMLYSISASMFSPLGWLSEEENKGSRSHCVVGFLLFFLECVFVYWSFAFACQSLTMGVVLFSSQVIVSAGYDKIFLSAMICFQNLKTTQKDDMFSILWTVDVIFFYTVFF